MKALLIGAAVAMTLAFAADLTLVQPKDLAAQLAVKGAPKPVLLHVGPNFLYRGKHIPGSIYVGQGSTPAGLAALKQAAAMLPRNGDIVLYCGCCPWDHCPNIKPAADLLKQMGFTHVRAMYVETNFAKDWTDHGYPVEAGTPKK